MVVFTCSHCGESVQKPKVEKHYQTVCRKKNPNLSCMDCFKDFLGEDYKSHNKCMTEEQRYSAKGFVSKEKKGEKKQTAWVEMVQSVLHEQKNASASILKIIEAISKHQSIPRKKPKFINFVKNVCGAKTNSKDIDEAWEIISVKLNDLASINAKNQIKKEDSKHFSKDTKDQPKSDETKSIVVEKIKDTEDKDQQTEKVEVNNEGTMNGNLKETTVDNLEVSNGDVKKKSKKERKEEKKRMKYEEELKKAGTPIFIAQEEEKEETEFKKKEKKKKNQTDSTCEEEHKEVESKSKSKNKRKRRDTSSSAVDINETLVDNTENEPPLNKEKSQKKKLKMEEDILNDSVCLHDQNVAKIEEETPALPLKGDFDFRAIINSLFEKKREYNIERIQKKVLGEYSLVTGKLVDERINNKFFKILSKMPNIIIDKKRVMLKDE